MMLGYWIVAGLLISFGIFSLAPIPVSRSKRMRIAFGFEQTEAQAKAAGIRLNGKRLIQVLLVAVLIGVAIAYFTRNIWFVGVGGAMGVIVPKMIISAVTFKRRMEILMNLPGNLRLLSSKFRDCKSLQKSLEMSLSMMSGVTVPLFEQLYSSLRIGLDVPTALENMKREIRFKKFDDFCEKVIAGNKDGFHLRSVEGIRESIADLSSDMNLLQEIDLENEKKRIEPFVVFGFSLVFPFLFGYLESQLVQEFKLATTLQTGLGKLLLASMIVSILSGLWKKDKLLRLNLDDL
ncbi:type II secretion system F family protein [Paenibacillus sp. FSL L8-0463]|uniref:type II secretion system F family protein n=1 Tax=Paenibacillus sp. FSL L8-0463 TaxID=2954687 RepID=UPI00311A6961